MKDKSENANVKQNGSSPSPELKVAPKKKLVVKDAVKLDKKIPRNLLLQYGDNWYITKAGLELKANWLYGGGNFSITLDIIERSPKYVLAKATFISGNSTFVNYGEASKLNVKNTLMHSQLLHLALTRAECRVLRMATACGYVSVEEMDQNVGLQNKLVTTIDDGKPATDAQISTLRALGLTIKEVELYDTFEKAKMKIIELSTKKGSK